MKQTIASLFGVRCHLWIRFQFILLVCSTLVIVIVFLFTNQNDPTQTTGSNSLLSVWSFPLLLPPTQHQHRRLVPNSISVTGVSSMRRLDSSLHISEDEGYHDDSSGDALPTFSTTTSSSNAVMKLPKSSKTDLYSNEELMGLLNLHESLSGSVSDFGLSSESSSSSSSDIYDDTDNNNNIRLPSLQDLIVQTIQDISDEKERTITTTATTASTTPTKFHTSLTPNELLDKIRNVRAIVSDVDGTLLGNDHTIHPITEQAIVNAVNTASSSSNHHHPSVELQHFFLATGKTRIGAYNSLGFQLQSILQSNAGVFVQGLYCIDGRTGQVIYEKKLLPMIVERVEAFIIHQQQSNITNTNNNNNITLLAYDGDSIYYLPILSHVHHLNDVSTKWGEPNPLPLNLMSLTTYEPSFHKILLMGDDADTMSNVIRPQLEVALTSSSSSDDYVITQAIPTMLEVLPGGCSKAVGVQKLCEYYNIDLTTQVCAIGDAENDYDMIRTASLGIAVGNAVSSIKDVADIVMDDTSTDGAAGYAIELFGLGKINVTQLEQ